MDRLRALEIFKAVVSHGSFVKGAEAMNLSNSVATHAVQSLEALLGVRLLQRTTRRIALTAVGQSVLDRATALLDSYAELETMSSLSACEVAGDIRLVAPVSYGMHQLGPALASFLALYPKVRVDLRMKEASACALDPSADLVLCVAHELPPSVIARKVTLAEVGIYASPVYLARAGTPEHPRDLLQHDCLTYEGTSRRGCWQFIDTGTQERLSLQAKGSLVSNHAEALISAAAHGAGVVLMPHFLVDRAIAKGALRRVLRQWETEPLGVYLAYTSRRNQPLCVRRLIDHLAQALAAPQEGPPRAPSSGDALMWSEVRARLRRERSQAAETLGRVGAVTESGNEQRLAA
jgi:LysR family transcriptional regulator, regulator for bpeEF and oprC